MNLTYSLPEGHELVSIHRFVDGTFSVSLRKGPAGQPTTTYGTGYKPSVEEACAQALEIITERKTNPTYRAFKPSPKKFDIDLGDISI